MRTLIYCTAFAPTALLWDRRYRRWVDAVLSGGLLHDQILLVDDGSPVLPGWPDTDIVTLHTLDEAAHVTSTAPVLLLRFPNRLGRAAVYDFPGWYRSFASGARYAQAARFQKVLHIESDAYIVSPRMRDWANAATAGWRAPYSAKYDFPEMAIQVIGLDQLGQFAAFSEQPYSVLKDQTHETALPLTHVEKSFFGDRFGEEGIAVPANADFATQVPPQREDDFYWWLGGATPPVPGAHNTEIHFGRGGAGVAMLGDGWANPEPAGTWMINLLSVIKLPGLPSGLAFNMVLAVVPHTQPVGLLSQRLIVQLNGTPVGGFDCNGPMIIGCEIPANLLRGDGTDRLRFLHPDAAPPARFHGADRRNLAFMLRTLTLLPRDAGAA